MVPSLSGPGREHEPCAPRSAHGGHAGCRAATREEGGARIMLDRGLTILRIRGIPVRLHPSLIVFLPYLVFVATRQLDSVARLLGIPRDDFPLPPLAWGVILAVGLFVAVLAHELCHSLVAIRSGARVRSITLMMLGGVSLHRGRLLAGARGVDGLRRAARQLRHRGA